MKIKIFHATAGYGHKKVADVIGEAFRKRGLSTSEVQVEDALDYTSFPFRQVYPASYYYAVKWVPALWGAVYEFLDQRWVDRLVRPFRRLFNRFYGHHLLRRTIEEDPDFIICTHFFSAELFATAKKKGRLRARLTTVITDFSPHAVWLNEGTDDYWVMNESALEAMRAWGIHAAAVHAGGIPVDPVFLPTGRKVELLEQYGFEAERFTLLMTSGSFGFGPYRQILEILEKYKDRIQCFVVCGNNRAMKKALEKESYGFPVKIFGFVDFMPDLMEASDLVLAKSGGATTVETLAKGVPMIVLEPIPGQETRNADFLAHKEASLFMKKPADIEALMQNVLSDGNVLGQKIRKCQQIAKPHAADDLVSLILDKKRRQEEIL